MIWGISGAEVSSSQVLVGSLSRGFFCYHQLDQKKYMTRKKNFIETEAGNTLNPELSINYTTWKVDGATPMYWFIMAPY